MKKTFGISAGSGAAVNDKKTIEVLALAFGAYFAGQSYSYEEKAESMFSGASFVCAEVHNDSV